MTSDAGLAPNPFWGACTLAICTPNHVGARLEEGDWIAGFLSRPRGGGLVYAMKIDEILPFDDYFQDPRYKSKKPVRRGAWPKPVGDNMYFRGEGKEWRQHPTNFHTDALEKDTAHPHVFISHDFYYFGKNRPIRCIPSPGCALEEYWLNRKVAQGLKYFRESEYPSECSAFIKWLRAEGPALISDVPLDAGISAREGCADSVINSCS